MEVYDEKREKYNFNKNINIGYSFSKGIPCVQYSTQVGMYRFFSHKKRHLNTIIENLKKYIKKGKDIDKFKKFLNKKKKYRITF